MANVETLTAYRCKFSYLRRNNPLLVQQREAIQSGEVPFYTISDFLADYIDSSSKLAIGENTNSAILLSSEKLLVEKINENVVRSHLMPCSGKQGKPLTIIKRSTSKRYNFGSDSAALYDHHIFIYEGEGDIIAIFHRQNGSGCKSVFLETANKVLKPKGLKLEMDLLIPLSDSFAHAIPTKLTLQYTQKILSSDIADNCKGKKERKQVVRDLGFNLTASDNSSIFNIFRNMQLGRINQEVAFAQIKAECPHADEYNDAVISLRFGRQNRPVKWNEFERFCGSHDISESLRAEFKKSKNFVSALTKIVDQYYYNIMASEDTEHAQ